MEKCLLSLMDFRNGQASVANGFWKWLLLSFTPVPYDSGSLDKRPTSRTKDHPFSLWRYIFRGTWVHFSRDMGTNHFFTIPCHEPFLKVHPSVDYSLWIVSECVLFSALDFILLFGSCLFMLAYILPIYFRQNIFSWLFSRLNRTFKKIGTPVLNH